MKKQIAYVSPLRAGVVLALLYAAMALVIAPFFVLIAFLGSGRHGGSMMGSLLLGILGPIAYAIIGFLLGVIGAALYNLIAKWTGGLEIDLRD